VIGGWERGSKSALEEDGAWLKEEPLGWGTAGAGPNETSLSGERKRVRWSVPLGGRVREF